MEKSTSRRNSSRASCKNLLLFTSVAALCGGWAASAWGQSQPSTSTVDEVVVTGSYIKRDNLTSSSPLSVVDREAIRAQGFSDPGQILTTLPANVGSEFNSGLARGGATVGTASVNLRGVGVGSTLVLLDGARQVKFAGLAGDNTQSFVDINSLVPQIAIQRVDVVKDGGSALYGSDAIAGVVNFITRKRFDGLELSAEGRWTTDFGDQRDLSVSALYGHRGERGGFIVAAALLDRTNLNGLDRPGLEAGKALSANGQPGTFLVPRRDASGALVRNASGALTFRSTPDPLCGAPGVGGIPSATACRLDFGLARDIIAAERRQDVFAEGDYRLSDTITASAQLGFHHGETKRYGSPSAGILASVPVPGYNPGNPFRAVNANGQPLFAVPDPAHPDRPLLNAAGEPVLTATPTDPSSGIAFNENVFGNLRVLGPGEFPSEGGDPACCAQASYASNDVARGVFGLDGELPLDWSWSAQAVYAQSRVHSNDPETDPVALNLALRGLGGMSGNDFFNPFGSGLRNSALQPVGPAQPGDPRYNTLDIVNFVLQRTETERIARLQDYRLVLTGPVLQLPAGAAKVAVGIEHRREGLRQQSSENLRTGNVGNGGALPDFSGSQKVTGVFGELFVPLLQASRIGDAELQAAVRHEAYGEGFDTTDPKVAVRWQPLEGLSFRASYATAFTAPTIFQEFGRIVTTRNVTDPADRSTAFRGVVTTGNPDLQPETATSVNFGATVRPLSRLTIDVDHWKIDYKGKIAVQNVVPLVAQDPFGPQVIRDPNTGRITQINVLFFNAASVLAEGTDVSATYDFPPTDWGRVSAGLDVSHVGTYDIVSTPGATTVDALGNRNFNNIGVPMPSWRGVAHLTWTGDRQSASVFARYVDRLRDDESGNAVVKSHFTVDAQYEHEFPLPNGDRGTLTVGAINLLGQSIPDIRGSDAFIQELYDPRERVVYARATANF
jgi:outer membrane receptor protein involved in Fe transport